MIKNRKFGLSVVIPNHEILDLTMNVGDIALEFFGAPVLNKILNRHTDCTEHLLLTWESSIMLYGDVSFDIEIKQGTLQIKSILANHSGADVVLHKGGIIEEIIPPENYWTDVSDTVFKNLLVNSIPVEDGCILQKGDKLTGVLYVDPLRTVNLLCREVKRIAEWELDTMYWLYFNDI